MNPADFLAAKVYTGSKNIVLIRIRDLEWGMYMNRAAKRLLYLGAAVSLCLSMGWGAAGAADLSGAPHEVVTAQQEMVPAAPQVILNPNIRYANAARTGMIQQERQNNIINILGGHSYAM